MTRTDPAAEAREWLRDAPIEQHQHNDLSRAALCVHMAKAEATLALVEQQRIANLIALVSMNSAGLPLVRDYARHALASWHGDAAGEMKLRPEIAAALGIGEQP